MQKTLAWIILSGLVACSIGPILELEPGEVITPGKIEIELLTEQPYPPKEHVEKVEIFYEESSVLYAPLAKLKVFGSPHESPDQLVQALRSKAALLGADALVQVKTGWRMASSTEGGYEARLQQEYGLRNNSATGLKNQNSIPWASALAVHYK